MMVCIQLDSGLASPIWQPAGASWCSDTVPGPEPEALLVSEIPALIVPGKDSSHAPSAGRYRQECLPANQYWDVPVAEQTAETALARVIEFLASLAL
jgi:hypothetical protein